MAAADSSESAACPTAAAGRSSHVARMSVANPGYEFGIYATSFSLIGIRGGIFTATCDSKSIRPFQTVSLASPKQRTPGSPCLN